MHGHFHHIKRVVSGLLAITVVGLGSVAAAEVTTLAATLGPWVR